MNKFHRILNLHRNIAEDAFRRRADELSRFTLIDTQPGIDPDGWLRIGLPSPVVVSLTSYGKRIFDVSLTIESIMQQTLLPSRIILWLDDSFSDIPTQSLRRLEKRGLEVRFCSDLRSYKKIVPTLELCPEHAIITIDDDALYFPDMIERLCLTWKRHPGCVCANRVYKMKIDKHGLPTKYKSWAHAQAGSVSEFNFPCGVGGVLYPPGSLHPLTTDDGIFMKMAPTADDVWLKAMAVFQARFNISVANCVAVETATPFGEDYLHNPYVQDMALFHKNIHGGENDKALHRVWSFINSVGYTD